MKKVGNLSIQDLERLYKAEQLLCANLRQGYTIKELASTVLLTEKKLKIGFKILFGAGVHTYLRNRRLEKVKIMLLEDKPHKAILWATGFKSESGLSKTFKKVVGVTPTEWKNAQGSLNRAS
jgi:AraC-like DNA-binding protein